MDATLIGTFNNTNQPLGGTGGGTYTIGARLSDGSGGFKGDISEVFISSGDVTAELTSDDLLLLQSMGPKAFFGDFAVAIWDFATEFFRRVDKRLNHAAEHDLGGHRVDSRGTNLPARGRMWRWLHKLCYTAQTAPKTQPAPGEGAVSEGVCEGE